MHDLTVNQGKLTRGLLRESQYEFKEKLFIITQHSKNGTKVRILKCFNILMETRRWGSVQDCPAV